MDFKHSTKARHLMQRVEAFMEAHVYPAEKACFDLVEQAFGYARYCRIAVGPDQVHMAALGKQLIRRHNGQPE